jgi:hypothetical protein
MPSLDAVGHEGPCNGVPDEVTVEAIQLAARTEGMLGGQPALPAYAAVPGLA